MTILLPSLATVKRTAETTAWGFGSKLAGRVHHGRRVVATEARGGWSHYIGHQKAESDGDLCSVPFSSNKDPKATRCCHPIIGSFFPPQLSQSRTSLTEVSRNLLSIPTSYQAYSIKIILSLPYKWVRQLSVSIKNTWDNPLTKKRSQCNSRFWGCWSMNNQSHWSVIERQQAHHSKHGQLSKTTRPHTQEAEGRKKGPRYHHLLQGPPTHTRLYPLEVQPPLQQFHFMFNQVWLLIMIVTQGTHPWVYSGAFPEGAN